MCTLHLRVGRIDADNSIVIALFLHTVHSLSKNPIGDEGFCTIVDAFITKPGRLKELG